MLEFYNHLPSHINPLVFSSGFFTLRWYSLSYIVGFLVIYALLRWRIEKGEFIFNHKISNFKFQISNLLLDFMLLAMLGAIVGGRLGYVFFYDAKIFFAHPLAIVSPYAQSGKLVGIFGMSFYGGLLGALGFAYAFAKIKKLDFLAWTDFFVPALGAGYFFGRVGNFLNGELWGRVTESKLGMYFPLDQSGLLRHPSQIYEALGEGIFLFLIFWKIRNKKFAKGNLLIGYVFAYALVRFWLEFLREPDAQTKLFFDFFTTGQMLSLGAILIVTICGIMNSHGKKKTS